MLPLTHKIMFLLFALICGSMGLHGFYKVYRRIRSGSTDPDARFDRIWSRAVYALTATLSQIRTLRRRPIVNLFHAMIFYGFAFYVLVNLIETVQGFFPFEIASTSFLGALYNLVSDLLSAAALIGVLALVLRRFLLPSGRDFRFNERTVLHEKVRTGYIRLDSLIVSAFICFHVGSHAIGGAALLSVNGPDRFQPFEMLISHLISPATARPWWIFSYWGAIGSVLVFLAYFPYTKHIHILMAPTKYFFARNQPSGVFPALNLDMDEDDPKFGAKEIFDLSWPRLLDAYACIQCNRCQDVCPATATGKSLSPAALEINKRMELNQSLADSRGAKLEGRPKRPLVAFALSTDALWSCTTCGACMQVCPVQNEQMFDIVDIRRHEVMMESDFPAQLQSVFRGLERMQNPWGIGRDQRMAWAEGLHVPTIEQNPAPDILYWVGCAASYDPQSQKTARAFVKLLGHAKVNYAVLGNRERCTGDSARRAGNEYLYRQLAEQNIATLSAVKANKIVVTCPHCLNTIGREYRQLGADFTVVHHTEFLASLLAEGKIRADENTNTVTYHDPCYLGRHNGIYHPPRTLLRAVSNDFVEMNRRRENAFCCGAGGAQFWKEEEPGTERISSNRMNEARQCLSSHGSNKVLAVGCPFCKSMLETVSSKEGEDLVVVKDVAELLLESIAPSSSQNS
jgi:Fe-S oxidoreductase